MIGDRAMTSAAHETDRPGALLERIVQTNLDLYRQLHRLGYGEADLKRARDAYLLVMRLFSDRFRANGKPFVAHLVGTASLLAGLAARPDVVIAGLLHAVYANGSFPDGERGMTAAHRQFIRAKAGDAVEGLVAAYEGLVWNRATIARFASVPDQPSSTEADILTMRLANEIEDHYALGMRLCSADRDEFMGARPDCIAIARRLGRPELADALAHVYREADEGHWAEPLATDAAISFRLPGPSSMTGSQHIGAGLAAARTKLRRLLRI
jgi:HD domain